jgi:hypothetical protein
MDLTRRSRDVEMPMEPCARGDKRFASLIFPFTSEECLVRISDSDAERTFARFPALLVDLTGRDTCACANFIT